MMAKLADLAPTSQAAAAGFALAEARAPVPPA